MSDKKKKRASLLDNLATAAPSAAPMIATNRALRSARDAVDGHNVWELDPWAIDDTRIADRLDPSDVVDLRDAIEANGQTVPILVRRDPEKEGRYLLVYGRRRLEAIRSSDQVTRVRALVASLDDDDAVRAQISENMARRDLSFIEKALFAQELIDQGFGTQTEIAEILTASKSAISMALGIVEAVTPALARAIGPAHGIGRPRWDKLAKILSDGVIAPPALIELAHEQHDALSVAAVKGEPLPEDFSTAIFEAVLQVAERATRAKPAALRPTPANDGARTQRRISADAAGDVLLRQNDRKLNLEISNGPFAQWLNSHAEQIVEELHARYKMQVEDRAVKQEKGGT